jgi:hypothetical protein
VPPRGSGHLPLRPHRLAVAAATQHLGGDIGHEGQDLFPVAPYLPTAGEALSGVGRVSLRYPGAKQPSTVSTSWRLTATANRSSSTPPGSPAGLALLHPILDRRIGSIYGGGRCGRSKDALARLLIVATRVPFLSRVPLSTPRTGASERAVGGSCGAPMCRPGPVSGHLTWMFRTSNTLIRTCPLCIDRPVSSLGHTCRPTGK